MENIKRYPITSLLIGISVLLYIYTTVRYGTEMDAYQAIEAGAFNPEYVLSTNEYWRLISANFLHFGIMHLVVNCYSLYNVGSFLESFTEREEYSLIVLSSTLATTGLSLVLYLVTGIGGSSVSAGISGVIFGLLGAMGALALLYRSVFEQAFRSILPSLAFMLVISLMVPSISLTGHVTGLIGGFISAYIIFSIKKQKRNKFYS